MVEYPDLQGKNILEIEPKYYNNLNIDGFSKMMKSPSYCYKFYWLEAIIQSIFWGWIQYEKVKWLQNNNPEVPGLVYKLTPTEEKVRKLKKVRDLWQDIMEVQEIRDVFTGQPVKKKKYDIDHFIP